MVRQTKIENFLNNNLNDFLFHLFQINIYLNMRNVSYTHSLTHPTYTHFFELKSNQEFCTKVACVSGCV